MTLSLLGPKESIRTGNNASNSSLFSYMLFSKKTFQHLSRMIIVLVFLFLSGLFIYLNTPRPITLKGILKAGEITLITRNNPLCYYQYRDQAMGFEYDLAKAFADYLGVRLKIKTIENWKAMFSALMEGKGAFIASGMPVPPFFNRQLALSDNYLEIYYHIVIHRNNPGIKELKILHGKTVHVNKESYHREQFEALAKRGIDIEIKQHSDLTTEELISLVAENRIEVVIAAGNIAKLNRRYYPQIMVSYPINGKECLNWALSPKALNLLEQVNRFFKSIRKQEIFSEIYDNNYSDIETFDYVDLRAFHRRIKTRLPGYRAAIEKAAHDLGFDWRLIAAQAYQESHFIPDAKSHSGAFGIMQLTLNTARSLGVKDILNPEQNIKAGVKHLKKLYDFFDNAVEPSRTFIALAAYNVGQGHIWDARNLAKKMNLDPDRWPSLLKTLPLLSNPKYYKNSKYGYCRGYETIAYINRIMTYYDILKRQSLEFKMDYTDSIIP